MNTALTLMVSLVVFVSVVWLLARHIRQDRPLTPPRSYHLDWRDDMVAWSRIGIR